MKTNRNNIIIFIAGFATICVGLLVIIGWQFNIDSFKSPLSSTVSMKANTAIGFLFSGFALILLIRSVHLYTILVRILGLAVFLLGLFSLCEYIFSCNFGIDELLYKDAVNAIGTSNPGRMSPNTALSFILLGLSFLGVTFQSVRNKLIIDFVIIFSLTISFLGILGYATGLLGHTTLGSMSHTKMAISTAICFSVLCVGLLIFVNENRPKSGYINQKLIGGFTFITVIFIFISNLFVSSHQSLDQVAMQIKYTNHLESKISSVLTEVINLETGMRGYIITDDKEYLDSWIIANKNLPELLNSIDSLKGKSSAQTKSLETLKFLIKKRIDYSFQLYDIHQKYGDDECFEFFKIGTGNKLTDSIRVLVEKMISEEEQISNRNNKNRTDLSNKNQVILYISICIQLLLLLMIFVVVHKYIRSRMKAEINAKKQNEELQSFNEELYSLNEELSTSNSELFELKENLEIRVTERTIALQQSEARYRNLVDNALVGVYESTTDGKVLFGNNAVIEMLGFKSLEEFLSAPAIMHHKNAKRREELISELKQHGKVENFENEVITKDGRDINILVSAKLTGNLLSGMVVDITSHKQAEKDLLAERDRAVQYFDTAGVIMVTLDTNGTVSQINKKGCEVLGYPATEIIGKDWFESFLPKNISKDVRNSFNEIMKGNIVAVEFFENLIVNSKGEERLIAWHNAILKNSNEQIIGTLSSGEDITASKQSEIKIIQQTEDLKLINLINVSINRGDKLENIIEMMSKEIMRIFNCFGTITSFPDSDGKTLFPKNIQFHSPFANTLEKMVGGSLSSLPLKIDLTGNGKIAHVMRDGISKFFNDADDIKAIMTEFTSNNLLKQLASSVFELLGFRSMILLPMVSNTKIIGMLEIARVSQTNDEELNRLNRITSQLVIAINQKINNEKIKESEEKYSRLVNEVNDGFYVTNEQGIFTFSNDALAKMLGFSKSGELIGLNFMEFVHQDNKDYAMKKFQNDLYSNNSTSAFDVKAQKTNGQIIFLEITSTLIKENNLASGFRGIIRDITEKKLAEEKILNLNAELEIKVENRTIELKKSTDEIKLLLNSTSEAIYGIDINGNCTFSNPACVRMLGYEHSEQLFMQNMHELIHHSVENGVKLTVEDCNIYKAFRLGESSHFDNEVFWRADGTSFPVEYWSHPIYNDGKISGAVVTFLDITERKSYEKELQHAKDSAEDANRMKSEFLANMSHEIRTPLNAIVGFSSILKEKAAGQNIFTEYLDNIIQSSKVLLNIINDILDLSKVEAGRMIIDYQNVSLENIIKEIQAVFQMKAFEKGISINIQIDDDIPGSLITDEKYLRQILFNLIGNAVKFTHKGSVDIIVNIIPKKIDGNKVDLRFIIRDTGIGMQNDLLVSIFEPFVQVKHKTKNLYGGTGLGLSITKRLVELLGGTISVESEFGKGSVFSIELLNVEIASLHNIEKIESENRNLSGIRFFNPVVLLVEDILSNRQVVKCYLEPMNITIIETENGEECIDAIRKKRPALVLMDMQMPVMDGYTAISIIKSDEALKDIPIIALTASGMKQQKDKFEKIADSFLIKPIYKSELLEQLIKYLPYEELSPIIENKEKEADTKTQEVNVNILTPEIKEEIIKTFMPSILKHQEILNIDKIIAFVKNLEAYNKNHQIAEITAFCNQLSGYIQTINIDKINLTLKQLVEFINK